MKKTSLTLSLALSALLAAAAPAALAHDHGGSHAGHGANTTAATAAEFNEGEIKKIDAAGAKLTLKHGELKSLGMPAMTMVFRVADPALLKDRKVGETIHFKAEKRGSGFVVTEIMAH